jgi:hypothetical protein
MNMESTKLTVSDTEVDNVIKNNVKSPGPGNIKLEIIKYGGRKFLALVTQLLKKYYREIISHRK